MGSTGASNDNAALVWLRRDLRLIDNAAASAALTRADRVYFVFVFDTNILAGLPKRDRRVHFIHSAIDFLNQTLRGDGSALLIEHGCPVDLIPKLAAKLQVSRVVAARDYEPQAIARDKQVAERLQSNGRSLSLVKDHVIFENNEVATNSGSPYTVFTPYKKKWLKQFKPAMAKVNPRIGRANLASINKATKVPSLSSLGFERSNLTELPIDLAERGANKQLTEFGKRIENYASARDFPAVRGPSYLSVHLRFGTVSIRQAVSLALKSMGQSNPIGAEKWLSELIWRDFYFQILANFPHVVDSSFKAAYDRIQWASDPGRLKAWRDGLTGYPLVDAAMAQINRTGYMHNRLRMVVASFLCKDLGIDWREGERYFSLHLNDFELAANNGGWQWASSSGCDAQPYFRIFNPISQSRKFDPNSAFIRKYLPQLAELSDKHIHAPWLAPADELTRAGVELGNHYPFPIVDHDSARRETLMRYEVVKAR